MADGSRPLEIENPRTRTEAGMIASSISRHIVQLHAKLYGRGPTKAKTYLEADYALCVLEQVFTPAEETLIAAGHGDQVEGPRHAFQLAVADRFTEIVETESGREVTAFISQVSIERNLAIELFLFKSLAGASSDGRAAPGDGGEP
jgi:uncharacterized protein YbcI